MGVYVDDLLATGTDEAAIDRLFDSLANLSIKELSRVSKFLGIRVAIDDDDGYVLDQKEVISDLLREDGRTKTNLAL